MYQLFNILSTYLWNMHPVSYIYSQPKQAFYTYHFGMCSNKQNVAVCGVCKWKFNILTTSKQRDTEDDRNAS